MSTIGYESWAVDLAEVGPVYPFQGAEFLMFIIGLVFWIGFHLLQHRQENEEYERELSVGDPEKIAHNIDRY